MEKKIMQPIVYMIAGICSAVIFIAAFGFVAIEKINQLAFVLLLALAVVTGFGIIWGVKTFWFKLGPAEVGLDTLKEDLDKYTKQKLKEIQTDVNLHKESITSILKDVNEADERLSKHSKSINDLITNALLANSKIQATYERITPPGLELIEPKIVRTNEGFSISLFFRPDRTHYTYNRDVIIIASIRDNENSKILRMQKLGLIQVDLDGPFIEPDDKTGVIKAKGKTAALVYKFPVRIPFLVGIVVTEPCKLLIRILADYIDPKEFEIDVTK